MTNELDYLKEIRNEIDTAQYGEGYGVNLPGIVSSINKRIKVLEDAPKPNVEYKTDFCEIFNYAEREFGIGWNPCNDLFFNDNALTYKSYNEYNVDEILENFAEGEQEIFTKEEIHNMSDTKKTYAIIHHFMVANDIDDIFIGND